MLRKKYLNSSGSRWVHFMSDGSKEQLTFTTKSGKKVVRTAQWYESFGDFATVRITYKGKKLDVFTDTVLED